jgi:hypothetical protein
MKTNDTITCISAIEPDFEHEGLFDLQSETNAYAKGFDDAKVKVLQCLTQAQEGREGEWKDCAEYGWTIIANASGGDWTKEAKDWQEAAARFRDQYHACLAARPIPSPGADGDTKRLDWLEKNAEELFRDKAEDATGGWFCVIETAPQSLTRPLGEFHVESGHGVRATIDAAMLPRTPEVQS